jgi:hypothetical protein
VSTTDSAVAASTYLYDKEEDLLFERYKPDYWEEDPELLLRKV